MGVLSVATKVACDYVVSALRWPLVERALSACLGSDVRGRISHHTKSKDPCLDEVFFQQPIGV